MGLSRPGPCALPKRAGQCDRASPSTASPSASLSSNPSLVHLMLPPRRPSPALGPFLFPLHSCKHAATKQGERLPFVAYNWKSKGGWSYRVKKRLVEPSRKGRWWEYQGMGDSLGRKSMLEQSVGKGNVLRKEHQLERNTCTSRYSKTLLPSSDFCPTQSP